MSYFTRVLFRKAIVTGAAAAFTYKMLNDEEFRNKTKEKGKEVYENLKTKGQEAVTKVKEYIEKENDEVCDGECCCKCEGSQCDENCECDGNCECGSEEKKEEE